MPPNFQFIQGDIKKDMSQFFGRVSLLNCRCVLSHVSPTATSQILGLTNIQALPFSSKNLPRLLTYFTNVWNPVGTGFLEALMTYEKQVA